MIYYVHVIYKTDLIVLQKKHFIIYKKKFKGLSNLENSFKKLKNHFYYFLKKHMRGNSSKNIFREDILIKNISNIFLLSF